MANIVAATGESVGKGEPSVLYVCTSLVILIEKNHVAIVEHVSLRVARLSMFHPQD